MSREKEKEAFVIYSSLVVSRPGCLFLSAVSSHLPHSRL